MIAPTWIKVKKLPLVKLCYLKYWSGEFSRRTCRGSFIQVIFVISVTLPSLEEAQLPFTDQNEEALWKVDIRHTIDKEKEFMVQSKGKYFRHFQGNFWYCDNYDE